MIDGTRDSASVSKQSRACAHSCGYSLLTRMSTIATGYAIVLHCAFVPSLNYMASGFRSLLSILLWACITTVSHSKLISMMLLNDLES